MQTCSEKEKIMNTINEELNLDESADESNKFDVILLSILR